MFTYKKDNLKVPIKVWMKEEDYYKDVGMVEQIENTAQLPFAFHHAALCPDGHLGFGAPIGGILATKDVIVPNFVGKDIGCGLCAVKTSLTEINTETLKKIMGEIRKVVPVGFSHQKEKQDKNLMPIFDSGIGLYSTVNIEYDNALKSLGTLGGGNHFIEIQRGSDGHIWIMIHSGSRNLGLKIANYYNKLAVKLNEKWHSSVPKNWELAYLPIDSEEGQVYLGEMKYAVEFALANRQLMMDRIIDIFNKEADADLFSEWINIAHNYASLENHFGQNVWVHRKGATKATKGLIGIIPGSLGSPSYIVEGLGNPESFQSCSHGSGRKMSRTKARKELDLESEIKILNEQNIIHGIRNKNDLDESVGSYKDIDKVMENQKDLVKILVKLQPIASMKG